MDLEDERTQALIAHYQMKARFALDACRRIEEAVRPILQVPEYSHTPHQTGSCVLLNVGDRLFALSAAHVFEPIGSHAVLVGGDGKLRPLTGDRFSTMQGPSGTHRDDPIDAVAFHVTGNVYEELREHALSVTDLDLSPQSLKPEFHVLAGYRASQSRRTSNQLLSVRDTYASFEHEPDDYMRLGLDRVGHVALHWEKETYVGGRFQTTPGLKGMSGGAIFRVPELFPDPLYPAPPARGCLAAVFIEHRKRLGGLAPLVVGTRIGYHLGLIDKYLPELGLLSLLDDVQDQGEATLPK